MKKKKMERIEWAMVAVILVVLALADVSTYMGDEKSTGYREETEGESELE